MIKINFKYADDRTGWEWVEEECIVNKARELVEKYNLKRDSDYEFISITDLDESNYYEPYIDEGFEICYEDDLFMDSFLDIEKALNKLNESNEKDETTYNTLEIDDEARYLFTGFEDLLNELAEEKLELNEEKKNRNIIPFATYIAVVPLQHYGQKQKTRPFLIIMKKGTRWIGFGYTSSYPGKGFRNNKKLEVKIQDSSLQKDCYLNYDHLVTPIRICGLVGTVSSTLLTNLYNALIENKDNLINQVRGAMTEKEFDEVISKLRSEIDIETKQDK